MQLYESPPDISLVQDGSTIAERLRLQQETYRGSSEALSSAKKEIRRLKGALKTLEAGLPPQLTCTSLTQPTLCQAL